MFTVVQRSGSNLEKPTEIVRAQATRLPWAWHGLCFGTALQEATDEGLRDLVNGAAPNYVFGTVWTRDNRGNPALSFSVSGNPYVGWADDPRHDRPSTAITAYVRLRNVGGGQVDGPAFYNPYWNNPPWSSWGIQGGNPDPYALYGSLSLDSTTENITPMTAPMATNEWFSIFLRWRSGETLTMDVLGERGNTISSVERTGTLSGSIAYNPGAGVMLNSEFTGGTHYYGIYSQALLWDRRLTDSEISALVADPYGWYSPRRETVVLGSPYPIGFGGGEMKSGTTTTGGLR